MSYNKVPTKDEKIPAKWKLTFTRNFWILFVSGIVLFILGWLLRPVFLPINDGSLSLGFLLQLGGIAFFLLSGSLFFENSSFGKTKPKRTKSFWVFWSPGILSLIFGLITSGQIGAIFVVLGFLFILFAVVFGTETSNKQS